MTSEWVGGTYSRQTIEHFDGLGAQHAHKQTFMLEGDHPEVFASEDRAPAPVETVLAALAGCLTAGVAAVAQHRGIQLRSVKATVEGQHNILGILGGDPEVRNGFNDVNVHFDIDADATPEEIAALVAQSQKRSAVFDALTNPTPVRVSVG
ncbi:MAG: OsmC family protein [Chloroflexota bacterium]